MTLIKRKQIAFNIDDPLQKEMYDHISQFKNFSFYGKSLIQRDMDGVKFNNGSDEVSEDQIQVSSDILESFI